MIKDLYTTEKLKELQLRLRKYTAISVALVVVAVAIGVVTCFFITDENAAWLKVTDIVLCSVCGCVSIYFLMNEILPVHGRARYAERMINSKKKTVRCRVSGTGKRVTATKYITIVELNATDENGKNLVLYWDCANGEPDFAGHIVEFAVVQNKITGYGDAL